MRRKKLLLTLPALIVAFIIVGSVAISGTTYTWEETFEVTKPEIECEIEICDCRIVGCPTKIWVMLKLEDGCGRCWCECNRGWEDKCDDDWKSRCCGCEDDCGDDWKEKCCCQINGTYSASLYWWNETEEDWHHLMYLQEEINVTLTGWKHVETYTFTPEMEGNYKVVVTFATETETLNFSSEE